MVTDKFGKQIEVGSYIAYSTSYGLRVARVIEVKQSLVERVQRVDGVGAWERIERPVTRLRVRTAKQSGTILYPNRVIVLSPEQISAEYAEKP